MTLLWGVLLASLAGSVHCAAMCGGFVCAYAAPGLGARGVAGLRAHLAYNGGRLVSYALLGAAAGGIGARVNDLGRLAGIGRAAAIVAGTLMVGWAISSIAASLGVRLGPRRVAPLEWAQRMLGALLEPFRDASPVSRGAAMGLFTTLLPCGWLYAFVLTAGSTGHALTGAAVMLVFWAGTVPLLLGVGLGARRLFGPLTQRLPLAGAALVLVLGLLAIAGRMRPPQFPLDTMSHTHGGR